MRRARAASASARRGARPARRPTPATSSPRRTARPTPTDGWQAGTCNAEPCSPETPGAFFTQAAGHPPIGFTQFIIKHGDGLGIETRSASSRTSGSTCRSASASTRRRRPQCDLATFTANAARLPAQLGRRSQAWSPWRWPASVAAGPRPGLQPRPRTRANRRSSASARPARNVFLKADVEWNGDYHEGFTIAVPEAAARREDPTRTASSSPASPATAPS